MFIGLLGMSAALPSGFVFFACWLVKEDATGPVPLERRQSALRWLIICIIAVVLCFGICYLGDVLANPAASAAGFFLLHLLDVLRTMKTNFYSQLPMKKLLALLGSTALLAACTFTISTDMKKDGETEETPPAEEVMEEGGMEKEEVEEAEETEETEEAMEAPAEEEAPADDGTVDGAKVEDAGGDGSDTAQVEAGVEVEVEAGESDSAE